MTTQATNTIVARLIVSKPNSAGHMTQVGTVSFDASNRATLATDGSGPAAEELKNAWQEMSSRKTLTWVHSQPATRPDGRTVTEIVGDEVAPGDGQYLYAVLDTLNRKYGYTVEMAK